jgi:hypothetical protein
MVLSVNSYLASKTVLPEAGNELALWVTLTVLGLTAAGYAVDFEQYAAFHQILLETILPETYPVK